MVTSKSCQLTRGVAYIYERFDGQISLYSLGADGAEGGEGIAADIKLRDRKATERRSASITTLIDMRAQGFTLIELLVVVAIVAVLQD